jgi:serine/threonine-protein kinase
VVVHGDVKPQNVLMSNGRAKLADFAMSAGAVGRASMSVSLASRAAVTGTDAYAAPEVLDSGRSALSPASDVFSFGMLLYHLVEEEVPWAGEKPEFIVRQGREGRLPPFRSADWSPELQEFVQGCCVKEPVDRFSAAEAARRVAGILQRLPAPSGAEDFALSAEIATLVQQVAEMHVALIN